MSKRKRSSDKLLSRDQSVSPPKSARSYLLPAGMILIVILACMAYFPSLKGDFIFDDELLLTQNDLIKASDGLYRIWFTTEALEYYPISYTVFWIEWRLWGLNPIGYHAVNLFLHAIEAILIWLILRKLSIPGAFFAAVIFTLHPVNVESVAWISQLRNLLAMFFLLLSAWSYLTMETPRSEMASAKRSFRLRRQSRHSPHGWYLLSLAFFVLALLSKGSTAVLPLLLLGIIWWRRSMEIKETDDSALLKPSPIFSTLDIVRISPFFMFSILSTGINIWFQTHGSGAMIRTANFIERLLGAGGVVWFYLYKALLPYNLSFIYPKWQITAGNPLWWLSLIAALPVTAVLWRYRNSWSRSLFLAWFFFCVALLPVMGFTDVGYMQFTLVADHYQHIAILGVIALVSAGFSLWQRNMPGRVSRSAAAVAGVAVVAVLMFLTWRQSGLYHDDITLYRATLKKDPDCWLAQNNLGLAMIRTGRLQEAIQDFQRVLQINPNYSPVYNNLGEALIQLGRPQDAIKYIRHSLELDPDSPEAQCNMGRVMFETGQLKKSEEFFRQAIKLKSNYSEAYYHLGIIQINEGKIGEAINYFRQAIQLNHDYPAAHNNLAIALIKIGQNQEAIDHFEEALRLQTNYPMAEYNMGIALGKLDRLPEAIKHYENAIRLKPDFASVYYNLTMAYADTNKSSEAIATAKKGLELARSQGLGGKAKQFEDWLNSHHATSPGHPDAPRSVNPVLP
jgi:protein O-mannosyl-transferase